VIKYKIVGIDKYIMTSNIPC